MCSQHLEEYLVQSNLSINISLKWRNAKASIGHYSTHIRYSDNTSTSDSLFNEAKAADVIIIEIRQFEAEMKAVLCQRWYPLIITYMQLLTRVLGQYRVERLK